MIYSVNHPSRTLAALQTPKVSMLNLPLTSQAVTRVSGSSHRCHNREASCLLAGGRGKQHTENKDSSQVNGLSKEPKRACIPNVNKKKTVLPCSELNENICSTLHREVQKTQEEHATPHLDKTKTKLAFYTQYHLNRSSSDEWLEGLHRII